MAFKLTLLSDVRSFLKGTQDVEQALDQVADSLDELAADTKANSAQAADSLEREFSAAFDEVKTEAKSTGRRIGDDLDDGTRRATRGVEDFRDEGKQSIRETAASFSDVTDALDMVQEIAANALSGFGPAGMAAGAAVAVGIGAAKTVLDDVATKAEQAKERVQDIADAVHDAEGNPALVDWAERLRDALKEVVDTKEWFEVWQDAPVDRMADWSAKIREFGLSRGDVMKAAMGDAAALARVEAEVTRQLDAAAAAAEEANRGHGVSVGTTNTQTAALTKLRDELRQRNQEVLDGIQWDKDAAAAAAELGQSNTAAATGTKALAEAQTRAQGVAQAWAESLADHLSVADEGLDKFVTKGKLNLDKWADAVERRARQVKRIEDFKVDVFPKLSPEAQEAFAKLPTETQAQVAKAYQDGSKGDRKKIRQTLEAEVDVKATVKDTSTAAAVKIPTTVDKAEAATQAADAAAAAQREADRQANHIEFKPKIDTDELQRLVNRAAAQITAPTIYANVKPRKDTP